jgi:hypothetical protein
MCECCELRKNEDIIYEYQLCEEEEKEPKPPEILDYE